MPGGKGNIRGDIDGVLFKKGNKAAEKWTEKIAIELANDLLRWMKEDDFNMFMDEYLCILNDYPVDLFSYLRGKFTSFSELYAKATKIQKLRLIKFGVLDKLNANMTKFVLINNHGMHDKSQIEQTNKGHIEFKNVSKQFPNED